MTVFNYCDTIQNMDTLHIGRIITEPQNRDAVHMAIAPIEAGEDIRPGHHVGLKDGKATTERSAQRIGIVDPFLQFGVKKGQKFWLFLYPGSITSLRHDWTHPSFGNIEGTMEFSQMELSIAWMHKFCEQNGIHYGYLISQQSVGGRDDLSDNLGDNKEFASHYSIITGKECPDYFSCAC